MYLFNSGKFFFYLRDGIESGAKHLSLNIQTPRSPWWTECISVSKNDLSEGYFWDGQNLLQVNISEESPTTYKIIQPTDWTDYQHQLISVLRVTSSEGFIVNSKESYREFCKVIRKACNSEYSRLDGKKEITSAWLDIPQLVVLGAIKFSEQKGGVNLKYEYHVTNLSFRYGRWREHNKTSLYRHVYVSGEVERREIV